MLFRSHTSEHLASAGADGQVRLWNLCLEDLMRQGCQWLSDYLAYGDLSETERLVCEDYWQYCGLLPSPIAKAELKDYPQFS